MKIIKSNIGLAFLSFLLSAGIVGAGALFVSQNSQNIPIIQNLNLGKQEQSINKPDKETILLLGKGGEKHDGGDLTDTIMIAKILNPEKQINLISIPRDFLVFDDKGYYSKINSVYINAINQGKNQEEAIKSLQDKITEITGINFDYYAEVDFAGFVKVVDKVEGVEVDVPEAIDDPYYPGPNYSYQRFTIPVGLQTLDGETALKYARTRYTSIGGDLDRSRRQQQILGNLKDRIFSLNPILDAPKIVSLFSIARENIKTDLSLTDMKSLYDTYQDSKDYTMKSLVVGNNLLTGNIKEGYRQFGSARGYILEPRIGEQNYLEIQEEILNINDVTQYQDKLSNLRKNKFELEIIWGNNLTKIEKTHIQEFLESRGFIIKVIESNKLDTIPNENTLYLGTNPYQQNQTEASSEIENNNLSKEYLQDILKPSLDTQVSLIKDIPILYITNPLKF
jgi:LCP family protein required for cell wall assembly